MAGGLVRVSRTRVTIKLAIALMVLSVCVLYAADYLLIRAKVAWNRQPFGVVKVTTTYSVTQKSGKNEFYFNPPEDQTCVHSLFPHLGYSPCWYLSRHTTQQINM